MDEAVAAGGNAKPLKEDDPREHDGAAGPGQAARSSVNQRGYAHRGISTGCRKAVPQASRRIGQVEPAANRTLGSGLIASAINLPMHVTSIAEAGELRPCRSCLRLPEGAGCSSAKRERAIEILDGSGEA